MHLSYLINTFFVGLAEVETRLHKGPYKTSLISLHSQLLKLLVKQQVHLCKLL